MRILELCLSSGSGGLELYLCQTFKRMQAQGFDVLAMVLKDSFIDRQLHDYSQAVRYLSAPCVKKLPFVRAWQLAKFLDQQRIDILHIHHNYDLALASLAKRFAKRPIQLWVHRHMNITSAKRDFYHRFIYQKIDRLFCVTKKLQNDYLRFTDLHPDKIDLLYLGTTAPESIEADYLQRNTTWSKSVFSVGLFGRLSVGKGQDVLIKAIQHLQNKHDVKIHAALIGHEQDPHYTQQLHDLIQDFGLQEQVTFLPFHPHPQAIMAAFDVIAVPSSNETFGLVNIEAMRAGKTVIAAHSDGIAEIIEHGKTGLLFPAENSQAFAEAIYTVYQDRNLLDTLAKKGKSHADQAFDIEKHYQKWFSILTRQSLSLKDTV